MFLCSARICSQHVPWFDNDKWSHHTKHSGKFVKCKDLHVIDDKNAEVCIFTSKFIFFQLENRKENSKIIIY